MNFPNMHFKVQFYLILSLAGVVLSACQALQPQPQCCRLEYGLLQPSDLSRKWDLVETPIQIIQPTDSRYNKSPASESTRQYLSGYPDERNKVGVIIHDIRRYAELAPSLGKLDFKIDTEEAGAQLTAPGLPPVGQDHQIQCLASSSSTSGGSLTVCIVEVRYRHILSTMYFYFDGLTSSDTIETLVNQALAKTDERIQKIDQHFSESSQ